MALLLLAKDGTLGFSRVISSFSDSIKIQRKWRVRVSVGIPVRVRVLDHHGTMRIASIEERERERNQKCVKREKDTVVVSCFI